MHMSNAEIWRFRQGGRLVSPQVGGRLALNNGEAMRDLAIAGLGLAMLPAFIVSAAVKNGILIEVMPEGEHRTLPIIAVWSPVSPLHAQLRAHYAHPAHYFSDGAPSGRW